MSTVPKIESSDLSIEDVYKAFYVVPDYQREYVWSDGDVQAFADDIHDEFYGGKGELLTDREYFIGSIVVCKDEQGVFELVDGQQRMTTIFLFLCAIRDAVKAAGEPPPAALEKMIFDARTGEDGRDVQAFRLVLQYEDSRDILVRVGKDGDPGTAARDATESVRCITEAYQTLRVFIEDTFHGRVDDIRRFFAAFIRRVKLIRIVTPSRAHALKVFETVNDRGVSLTAMDLLKNLLFMRAPPAEYPRLKALWKDLTGHLEACGEKPLRFLRYFVLATYRNFRTDSGKPVREDELYDWFTRNAKAVGIEDDPLEFARLLANAAQDYSRFASGCAPDGTPLPHLDNIRHLSGKARQHLILMLAGRRLPADALAELARYTESLYFVFVVVREPTKNFEWMFGDWSEDLRVARTRADVGELVKQRILPEIARKSRAFDFAMGELAQNRVPKYRMKYVLAKLAQYVDGIAWQDERSVQELDHYLDGKLEIEHILPQTENTMAWPVFDKPGERRAYVQKLGNLTLLEKPLNPAAGNDGLATKLAAYRESRIVLTRGVGHPDLFGKNTSLQRALALLRPGEAQAPVVLTAWGSTQIEERQRILGALARQVWLVSDAAPVESERPEVAGNGSAAVTTA